MLHIITGPMFSGKTTFLSNTLKKYKDEKVLYINHEFDTRGEFYYSHNPDLKFSENIICIKTDELKDEIVLDYKIIAIDESQFFKNIKNIILKWVEKDEKIIYIAGLISDYKREVFGEMNQLFIYADTFTKLISICNCGKDAIFSKRKNEKIDQIVVGASEYEPVCRKCYNLNL